MLFLYTWTTFPEKGSQIASFDFEKYELTCEVAILLCLSKRSYDFTMKRILKKVVDEFLLNSVILHIIKITIFKDLSFKVIKISYGGQKLHQMAQI